MGLTRDQAVALSESGWWKSKTPQEIVTFQLFEERLCMPFADFHEAMESAVGRPIWTHEFTRAAVNGLIGEFLKGKPLPSKQEILEVIPKEIREKIQLPG
jgi:hypothetical protein